MSDFLFFLIRASLLLTVLVAGDWLLFRRNTHFQLRRTYLLISMIACLSLPWINWQLPATESPLVWQWLVEGASSLPVGTDLPPAQANPVSSTLHWAWWIYGLGVGIMLLRLMGMIFQIGRLVRSADRKQMGSYTLALSDQIQAPFSFLHWLFVPTKTNTSSIPEFVHLHEQAHIQQKHSWDLILQEFLQLLLWFHPLSWLLKRNLLQLHEYLADQTVLHQGIPPSDYQQYLLLASTSSQRLALAQGFSQSTLKHRMMMMNRSASSARSRWNYLAILPVLAVGLFLMSGFRSAPSVPTVGMGEDILIKGQVFWLEDKQPIAGVAILIQDSKIGTLTDQEGSFTLQIPKDETGLVNFSFVGVDSYQIEFSESGRVFIYLDKAEQKHSHYFTEDPNVAASLKIRSDDPKVPNQVLYIVDGEELSFGSTIDLKPENIAKISVLKKEEDLAKYREKYPDINGIIQITTKK
ncbi:MAG: M56 family metallopeptidase [Bacteroidota bacterium]